MKVVCNHDLTLCTCSFTSPGPGQAFQEHQVGCPMLRSCFVPVSAPDISCCALQHVPMLNGVKHAMQLVGAQLHPLLAFNGRSCWIYCAAWVSMFQRRCTFQLSVMLLLEMLTTQPPRSFNLRASKHQLQKLNKLQILEVTQCSTITLVPC